MDTLLPINEIVANFKMAMHVMSYVWFIVLPPFFYPLFMALWLGHIQEKFWASPDWVVLELIAPKNIEKSPKPMEALYTGFAGVEKSFNVFEEYLDGAFTDYMSLELVSIEGSVHFYIRTMKKYRNLVEAHLYAQYPEVEIIEVPDYVNDVPKIVPNKQWDLWGADLEFLKEPGYPIKTYTAFEETMTGTMIDPLAGLVEIMGKIGPGQQIWLQWVIAPLSPKWNNTEGRKVIDKLIGKEAPKSVGILDRIWKDLADVFGNLWNALHGPVEFASEKKKEEQPLDVRLRPVERDILKIVEANLAKLHFKTRGRIIYIGRRENFDKSLGVSGFMGGIKQFNDENMNSMRPGPLSKTVALFVFKKSRTRYKQLRIFRRYKNRSFDSPEKPMVMSTEELATVFHLPDMNVLAPSLNRVEAKRGGAPSNLPIE